MTTISDRHLADTVWHVCQQKLPVSPIFYVFARGKETNTLETSCAYGKANVCMFPPISKGTEHRRLITKVPSLFSKTGLVMTE